MNDVAGVPGVGWFEDEDLGLGVGHRAMFHTARDDAEFAGDQGYTPVAKFDGHFTTPDQKEFVFLVMMVPREDALEFDELQLLAV